jgi:outer membrane protein W/outer membrane protein OmpA-like peptidoglycan-associated protein
MSSRFLIPLAVAAALAAPVAAYSDTAPGEPKGDWLFRVGLSQINPDETNLANVLGGDIVVDSDISPTANVEYMLTNHIGTELLVAWPFTHGIDLKTGDGGVTRVGHVDVLPPVLSVNYHFFPNSNWRPYVGAGINYTMFSGEESRGPISGTRFTLDDSIGAAGQVGIDVGAHKNWFLNANIRYIQIESDLEVAGVGNVGSVDINPWVYGLHVGYRLGAPAPLPAPAAEPPPPPPPPPAPAACADADGDGVCDEADKCPGTPAGTKVDKVGCPLEQTLKVLFDFDSAELRPESITELERVVTFMNDVPFATALVEGHTDSVGTEEYNQGLSDRRAKAVFDYLSSRGVDPARLKSIGHGELKPIADNATAEGRQLNRRVMLIRTDTGM